MFFRAEAMGQDVRQGHGLEAVLVHQVENEVIFAEDVEAILGPKVKPEEEKAETPDSQETEPETPTDGAASPEVQ